MACAGRADSLEMALGDPVFSACSLVNGEVVISPSDGPKLRGTVVVKARHPPERDPPEELARAKRQRQVGPFAFGCWVGADVVGRVNVGEVLSAVHVVQPEGIAWTSS